MKIKTRFAPSPTGKLHIGGARTALFNYLFSKHNNGDFFIRFENTDLERSTIENVNSIEESLKWLGILPTQKISFQSDNFDRHVQIANKLLEEGFAYKCYLTNDELEALRKKSRETGNPIKSPYRNDVNNNQKKDHVIRLKMPLDGNTVIKDLVQGEVSVTNKILDDMVLLRKDKTSTYMLASVVDDFDMKISHIIRGDDHLNNAFRQIQIIKYLKWPIPVYAHIPLIHGPDGTKLSKRHGSNNVIDYKKMGFEPITINNHLLRLGYSINDDKIYDFQKDDFVFKLNKLNQAPSKLDHKKLININSNFIKNAKIEYILKEIVSRYQIKERKTLENLSKLLPDLLKRYNFINEIENDLIWIDQKNFKIKDEAITKKLKDNNVTIENIYDLLKSCDWELNAIKTSIENYIYDNNKKISEIAPLIRLCLTGKTNTPDIFNVIFVLGKEACLKRLKTHG